MNFPFFNKNKNKKPESSIVQTIKSLAEHSNLFIFSDVAIYHHQNHFNIPLLIFDPMRGLYIFEIKNWNLKNLQNATITKKEYTEVKNNTLAYSTMRDIIQQKFKELLHHRIDIDIFNYLLFENLSTEEYNSLQEEIKYYLPEKNIIFYNLQKAEIFKKLELATPEKMTRQDTNTILGNLLIQYTIIEEQKLLFCNKEQRDFIDTPLAPLHYLYGGTKTGKTNILLLKAIVMLLQKAHKNIVIIKPNTLAKDLLQEKFLAIIEHAIIEIDLNAIKFLTPTEVINQHLAKSKRKDFIEQASFYIDTKLMKKNFYLADVVMCDDIELLPQEFIAYLKHIQKNRTLLLLSRESTDEAIQIHTLSLSYQNNQRIFDFQETNPYAKALHIIASLVKEQQNKILFVADTKNKEKFKDDLTSFVACSTTLIDGDKNLIYNNLNNLLLATYNDIVDINAKYVILLDTCKNIKHLQYALEIATDCTYILYEKPCERLLQLKDKLENNKK